MVEMMDLQKVVEKTLSKERYLHSLGVMERAKELAHIYGYDENIAGLVGIAHDIAREFSDEEIMNYVKENSILVSSSEKQMPLLLHGKIAADICAKQYGFSKEMQDAVVYHTLGRKNMTLLDKILFVADKSCKYRKFPFLEEIVKISNQNLDDGLLYLFHSSITRSMKRNDFIFPETIEARNFYLSSKKN